MNTKQLIKYSEKIANEKVPISYSCIGCMYKAEKAKRHKTGVKNSHYCINYCLYLRKRTNQCIIDKQYTEEGFYNV